MKGFITKPGAVILAFLLLNTQIYSRTLINIPLFEETGVSDIINYNEVEIYDAFNDINALTDALSGDGLSEAIITKEMVRSVDMKSAFPEYDDEVATVGPPLGVPSFLWGCAFGVVGIIVVYIFTDENEAELKKALNGCIVGYIVPLAIYMVFFAIAATSATTASTVSY